jgi:tRNA-dihydrouridine synthase
MKNNFWKELKSPFFALAPMEDVSDTVFRRILMEFTNPSHLNILFTEFVSTDGLCHPVGNLKVSHRLTVTPAERELLKKLNIKIVAQIWGSKPEKFATAAKMLEDDYDFDGIDINMGCPVKKIVSQKSCSALIGVPDLAKEIIIATQEATKLPVSIKTRTGLKKHTTEEWLTHLFETKPAAIILHARTQKMMSDYPAEWEQLAIAVRMRNVLSPDTIIMGNGDVSSIEDGISKCEQFGCEGAMIGRGVFHNPWIFSDDNSIKTPTQKLQLLWEHTKLYVETFGYGKNYAQMKRFFKIYTYDFPHAAEIRGKLMETTSLDEIHKVLTSFGYNFLDNE